MNVVAPRVLLAKTVPKDVTDSQTAFDATAPWCLLGHTIRVARMMNVMLTHTERLLESVGVPCDQETLSTFRAACCLSAWLHDLGKAGSTFQAMITSRKADPQLVRHEALSALIFTCSKGARGSFGAWREEIARDKPSWFWPAIAITVAGHHLRPQREWEAVEGSAWGPVTLFLSHPDVANLLRAAVSDVGLPDVPLLMDVAVSNDLIARKNTIRYREWIRSPYRNAIEALEMEDSHVHLLVGVMKATLIAADVAGSTRLEPEQVQEWLNRFPGEEEWQKVIAEHLREDSDSAQDSSKAHFRQRFEAEIRSFQDEVAASKASVTIVTAGCGSGKTVAAYRWAAARGHGRRLFFCYPTTATATAGWSDYIREADVAGTLFHSRRKIDLELLDNGDEKRPQGVPESYEGRWALDLWSQDAVICTADTVLGVLQNHRVGLALWPVVAQGAFVFDEVHDYDDLLFKNLLTFIQKVRAPILVMSASLPKMRREALERVVTRTGATVVHVRGPRLKEAVPRYHINWLPGWDDTLGIASDAVNRGQKVLVIRNNVDDVVKTGLALEKMLGESVVRIFHSRFRYRDRVQRQREIYEGMRGVAGFVAVTSQIAEMSFDVSADVLISDIAPIASIIQRLGRLARYAVDESQAGRAYFVDLVEGGSTRPYDQASILQGRRLIENLVAQGTILSQADLEDLSAKHWEQVETPKQLTPEESVWLDHTDVLPPRQIRKDGYNVSVLREEDVMEWGLRKRQDDVPGWEIPMLIPGKLRKFWLWRRLRGRPEVPKGWISYCSKGGAAWCLNNKFD